ncbi:MAG: hypothetical protein ACOYN6_09850 [Ignavibacteria bacterium]
MIIRKSDIPQLLLNNITGKIGGVIVRKRYGKTIVSAVPLNYKKSNSERAVNNRKRFAVISNIATALNKVPEFKELWKVAAKNKMSSQNAAAKYISRQVGKDGAGDIISIFPSDFSYLKCSPEKKNNAGFSVKVDYSKAFENSPENTHDESVNNYKGSNGTKALNLPKYIRIFALFMMKDSAFYPDRYKVICSDFQEVDVTKKEVIVETKFFDTDATRIDEYNNIEVRYAAILYNSSKTLLHVSNTHTINDY